MRASSLIPILAGVLLTSAWAEAAKSDDELRQSFTLGRSPELQVSNLNGPVVILGRSEEKIELTAQKRGGTPEQRARVRIEVESGGQRLKVRTRCPEESGGCRGVEVSYRLRVPQAASLRVSTVNGTIQASGFLGPIQASTVNGRIELRRGPGAKGELRASSVSGAVQVALGAGSHGEVKASSLSGVVESALPLSDSQKSRGTLRGKLGQGGPEIRASTVSGAITLR